LPQEHVIDVKEKQKGLETACKKNDTNIIWIQEETAGTEQSSRDLGHDKSVSQAWG